MKLFVKNLTHVDFSLFDTGRGLLGESWHTDVVLEGNLNDESMVCDFSIVKKLIKKWLDENIDHCLAIPHQNASVSMDTKDDAKHVFEFDKGGENHFYCAAPKQAFCILPLEEVTPEAVASWCEDQIMAILPADLAQVSITFTPEAIQGAQYQYSHGLKKHDGNCQRIAHGHRSTIDIFKDGVKSLELEQDWAKRWHDIYIGTEEDLIGIISEKGHHFHHFAYESQQGHFELIISSKQTYMIHTDTTVESLSSHITDTLANENPGRNIEVHAYEGIGKGAISNKVVSL
ncbi:hypothetical protein MED121_01565 [Marinomonas sp. MED121]|uniref:6-carboxytetrahydropterin synthase n=1 Tax=Marinomonas sp. MED121 TaxID=314277 RepID=UPI0000690B87|nr:6-carboxytetrahydropterin synthase [Marinomonas sp. MED121]EAQ65858.1 hypothetical protein MED121_01565 [Marinomonas sp. MED121]